MMSRSACWAARWAWARWAALVAPLLAGVPTPCGAAGQTARIFQAPPSGAVARAARAAGVPGCPDQGGILDSVTVPVGQPLVLSVVLSAPAPPGGVSYNVSSDNPAFVAAGDPRQGFIPTVTIPAGGTESNSFTIYGIAVGQTLLRLTALTSGYLSGTYPLGAWDINRSGMGPDQKFLDTDDPATTCRVAGSPSLSVTAAQQATCGKPIQGVASDGVSTLLLRTASGLAGTACFEIVSSSTLDQGTVQTPLTGTQLVSPLNYGFSYYTPPKFYGDSSPSRQVTVQFSFTPSIGNGNTSTLNATLQVVRPPVVLVHGLWSGPDSFSSTFIRNTALLTSQTADYSGTSASSFSVNAQAVQTAASQAVTTARRKGYATTQVDVAGHSMGGLLTRLYTNAASYSRPDNFGQGDVHRLVTLDTPHFGSSFANLLVSLHNVNAATAAKLESTVTALTTGSVLNGAVCDLAENSPALQALGGGTALASQVFTATGGPAGTAASPAPYWGGATMFGIKSFESALTEQYCTSWQVDPGTGAPICVASAYYFPQATVNAFRFQQQNDAVVSLSSQQGGLAGTNFGQYIHFHIPAIPLVQRGITDGSDVSAQLFQVLDGADSGLAAALPGVPSDGTGHPFVGGTAQAAADFAAQCSPGQPMKPGAAAAPGGARRNLRPVALVAAAADPRVNIVSPVAGTLYSQGSAISVVVQLSPPLTAANSVGVTFAGQAHIAATWSHGLSFTAVLPSSALATGPLTLIPDFTDTQGNVSFGAPVVVGVGPASVPTSMTLQQHNYFPAPGAPPLQLYVSGLLADGSVVNLGSGLVGTTYAVDNPAVLGVSADGQVSILGAGYATVTVRNGKLSDVANFVVEDPANPLPPKSVASQLTITRSGFQLNRSTGFYVQTVTLNNGSGAPLSGPLYLLVKNLSSSVTLVSKSGLTGTIAPLGSPYLIVPLPDGLTLPPKASVSFTLSFLNPARASITYTLDVLSTSITP